MQKWTVHDRHGNSIYLTQERWNHILRYHSALEGLLDELLNTLRKGWRRQDPADPSKYKYYMRCDVLPVDYNTIVVVVKFSSREHADGTVIPNNFVVTAWAIYIHGGK